MTKLLLISRIAGFESRRLLASPRWLIAAAVCMLTAWLAGSSVMVAAANSNASANAADIYLALVNNLTFVGYLLLPTFVLIASGSLAADRSSGFASLALTRVGRRTPLWIAKTFSVAMGALAFQAIVIGSCLVVALVCGLDVTSAPSALALTPDTESSMVLFAPAVQGEDMLLRVGIAASFLALVFAALGVAALAASVLWSKEYVPPALALGVIFFDWLAVRFSHWELYHRVSPSLHLLESTHLPTLAEPTRWTTSLLYFGGILVVSWIGGQILLERTDL